MGRELINRAGVSLGASALSFRRAVTWVWMRGILPVFLISVWLLSGQTAPPTFQTLSRSAEAARDAKQLSKALALYQRALKLKPDWDEGLWNLGSLAYDLD